MHGKDLCCLKILNFSDVQNVPSRIKQRFANLCNVQINNKMSEFLFPLPTLLLRPSQKSLPCTLRMSYQYASFLYSQSRKYNRTEKTKPKNDHNSMHLQAKRVYHCLGTPLSHIQNSADSNWGHEKIWQSLH